MWSVGRTGDDGASLFNVLALSWWETTTTKKTHKKKIFKFSNQIQFESLKFGLLCSLLLQVLHAK